MAGYKFPTAREKKRGEEYRIRRRLRGHTRNMCPPTYRNSEEKSRAKGVGGKAGKKKEKHVRQDKAGAS